MKRLKIFFHGNCFDGAASAALFIDFYRQKIDASAEVSLVGVQHGQGDPFEGYDFDGDDNVCLDFRYSDSPALTWWFDHHVSAFQPSELREHFEADTSGQKFYDPTASSCARFMAGILREKLGHDQEPFAELIHWADIIDGARIPDAKTAVELAEPALQLMTWLEHNPDPALANRYIHELGGRSLAEIVQNDWIQQPLRPVMGNHRQAIDLFRSRAVCEQGVVFVDLVDEPIEAHNKFIGYMLYPDARYTVTVTRTASRCKISVGSNPWPVRPRTHDIARICERYGGGGHPVVGGISVGRDEPDRARQIAREIREELSVG